MRSSFIAGIVLVFCLIVSFKQNSFAQKKQDYIIVNSGDTIFSKIRGSESGLKNYSINGGTPIRIFPDEVKEFYCSRIYSLPYASKILPNGKRDFVQVLMRGKLNLFQIFNSSTTMSPMGGVNTHSTVYIYACKYNTDSLQLVKSTALINKNSPDERRAIFRGFIADDKAMLDKFITDNSYSIKQIFTIVEEYNARNPVSH
ncbi:hypothetical protein ACJVDH_10020 [Pedobacter sp. AW1-32]|uniref:hypothetical protein n=1 Tax=Pedobacter sp. AW1-32 TaxID=3383026 RepID=UPI003FF102CF